MIIGAANKFVSQIHERMPIILKPDQFEPWLSGKAGLEILKPAAERVLQKHQVSKRVNSSRTNGDDATLIEPV
jgi:putative SOS response-associated peptidase YedK